MSADQPDAPRPAPKVTPKAARPWVEKAAKPPSLQPRTAAQPVLPAQPPRPEPSLRIVIGSLKLVTRPPADRPGKPQSSLGPVVRRGPRGHSIPRPDGG
ncbi:hypothetical protein [Paracoccus sp. KR1-242]|uniref:hypothetical protein n=1 Tax=Paracoccus sp. KR1-242 TaxID=3410028 RepID=UPI003BFDDA6B